MTSTRDPRPATRAVLVAAIALAAACARAPVPAATSASETAPSTPRAMNDIAAEYVRLALAVGVHDADYVDAYYGPAGWKAAADSARLPLADIAARATALRAAVAATPTQGLDSLDLLRRTYLDKQLRAMLARIDVVQGRKLAFDDESRAIYDAVAPTHDEAYFRQLVARLDAALPGTGPVPARYEAWRKQFVIPRERLDTVFRAAVAACRARTAAHVQLPATESFTIEYVTDKPWSGYNWYKGAYRSVIQVNTDLPIFIDRALDLACHEGYPGHHVYNALLERLGRERGWVEFQVYPLFSPQSLIAEGSANYGVVMAFPGAERVAFERERLFPLAGLDPARAAEYYRVQDLTKALGYAGNEAARGYLDGRMDATRAADWLVRYAINTPAQAAQRVKFFDAYRSYVINYNLGEDLVKAYVERRAGADAAARWRVFGALLSSPRLPSGLKE